MEQVIGVLRQKYTFLESILPISMILCDDGAEFCLIDKVVFSLVKGVSFASAQYKPTESCTLKPPFANTRYPERSLSGMPQDP